MDMDIRYEGCLTHARKGVLGLWHQVNDGYHCFDMSWDIEP
jgi:hypothetical protein